MPHLNKIPDVYFILIEHIYDISDIIQTHSNEQCNDCYRVPLETTSREDFAIIFE